MNWTLVMLGGALGTGARYATYLMLGGHTWPVATFFVNVLGSFLIGILFECGGDLSFLNVEARLLLGTGVLGGFTTYSAFNSELVFFLREGLWVKCATYAAATSFICLLAGIAGMLLGRALVT